MTEKERKIQKALGLINNWDVYLKYSGDIYYTIFGIEAATCDRAIELARERFVKGKKKTLRQDIRGNGIIFALKISGRDE